MTRRLVLIAASSVLAGAAAASDPYPFSGYYALETPGAAHAGCGFDVLHQQTNGAFAGYILDKPHWDANKEARYLRYKEGQCSYDAATATDNCVTRYNRIVDVPDKADRAKITIIDADAVAMLTLGEDDDASKLAGVPPFVFKRCPFTDEQIAPRLVDGVRTYTRAELQEMARARTPSLVTQVLETIAGAKNAVD